MLAMPCDLLGEINRSSARLEEMLRVKSLLRLQAVSGSLSTLLLRQELTYGSRTDKA
jgi:hypothetical protein